MANPWDNDPEIGGVATKGGNPWDNDPEESDAPSSYRAPEVGTSPELKEVRPFADQQMRATPSFTGELSKGNYSNAASIGSENFRRLFSGLIGPSEKERSEGMVPFGRNPDGSQAYAYKPLGDRMAQEGGVFTPFLKQERMEPAPDDTPMQATGKGLFNVASGVTGGLLSPGGVITMGGSAVPALGRTVAGLFGVQMASAVPGQVRQAMDPNQSLQARIEGGAGAAVSGLFGYGGLKGALRPSGYAAPEAPVERPLMRREGATTETAPEAPTAPMVEAEKPSQKEFSDWASATREDSPAVEPQNTAPSPSTELPPTTGAPLLRRAEAMPWEADYELPVSKSVEPRTAPEPASPTDTAGKEGSVPRGALDTQSSTASDATAQIESMLQKWKLTDDPAAKSAIYKEMLSKYEQMPEGPEKMRLGNSEGGFLRLPIPDIEFRKFSPLDEATGKRQAAIQASVNEADRATQELKYTTSKGLMGKTRKIERPEARRNALAVFIDEGGDLAKIAAQIPLAKTEWYRKAAQDALTLTPEELRAADHIKKTFSELKDRGTSYGVLNTALENYIPHKWDMENRPILGSSMGRLTDKFAHAKQRSLVTFFEGDQAGMKPKTLDVAKLVPAYLHEMNKVIADRQFVKDLMGKYASDGKPLVVARGRGQTLEAGDEGSTALVSPRSLATAKDAMGNLVDQQDYRVMENQPVLHKWKWVEGNGKDATLLKADLALHPEAYDRIRAMLGGVEKSKVGEIYDKVSGTLKSQMFSFSPFHQVQEGWHGIGHGIDPTGFFKRLSDIDMRDAAVKDAAKHGLMMHPDKTSSTQYLEGVGSEGTLLTKGIRGLGAPEGGIIEKALTKIGGKPDSATMKAIRLIGSPLRKTADIIEGYQRYLFHSYIPRLKYTTYEAILKRNMARFQDEMSSGKLAESDIKKLSAEQANAAYGHLNYAMMDRSPEARMWMQRILLAPDFLEARGRFVGQAAKGLINKQGQEQLHAMFRLAAFQVGTAAALSYAFGGKYDPKHPFDITIANRRYTFRSVPEDIYKAMTDTRSFVYGRINPVLHSMWQGLTGLNYRGEKVTSWDTFLDFLQKMIPIPARSIPAIRGMSESGNSNPITPAEQLVGSLGMQVKRRSPINETYALAGKWKESQGMEKDTASYPVSKYQQLRYALEDGNQEKARTELKKLMSRGDSLHKVAKGFMASVNNEFTGSKKTDRLFAQSLKPEDRATYDAAVAQRQKIMQAFKQFSGASLPTREDREEEARLFRR